MRTGWCMVWLSLLAMGPFAGLAGAESAGPVTRTTISVVQSNGVRLAVSAHVTQANDAVAPGGVVTFRSGDLDLGSAFVDAEGNASLETGVLAAGDHAVVAEYHSLGTAQSSVSRPAQAHASASTVAGFTVSAAPSSLNAVVGSFVESTVTVTPTNGFSGYVSLSCEGLPINTTCTFTPVSVLAACTATACPAATSVMQIQTQSPSPKTTSKVGGSDSRLVYAFVLPAVLGLAGLGVGRRRPWQNLVLVLATFAGLLSLTACAQRYRYLNHGPPANPGSTPGSFTITIESQSSNGSTTITPPSNPQIALTITAAQ